MKIILKIFKGPHDSEYIRKF